MIDSKLNELYGLAREGKYGSSKILDRTVDAYLAAKAKYATDTALIRILQKGIRQLRQLRAVEKRVMRF